MWKLVAVIGLAVVVAGCDQSPEHQAMSELELLFHSEGVRTLPDCSTDPTRHQPDDEVDDSFYEDGFVYCETSTGDRTVKPAKYRVGPTEAGFFIESQTGKSRRFLAEAGVDLDCHDGGVSAVERQSRLSDAIVTFKCTD